MFEFIDKIKDKYRQNRVEKLLKVQKSLSEIDDRIEELSKAQSHKYIRKEPDGKGGWNYEYQEEKFKPKRIEVSDSAKYNGQDMSWTETFTGKKTIDKGEWVFHVSANKINKFKPKEICVHPFEHGKSYLDSNISKKEIDSKHNWETHIYGIYLPEGTIVNTYSDDEYRFDLHKSDKVFYLGTIKEAKGESIISPKTGRLTDTYLKYSTVADPRQIKINDSTEKSFFADYISELAQLKLNKNKLLKSEQSLKNEDPLFKSMYDHMRFEATYKEVTKGYRQGQISLEKCDDILKAINNDKKVRYSDNLVFNTEGKLLLLKRSELDKTFPGMYVLPGGHVDAGEDHRTAAIRELQEESGLTPDKDTQFTKVGEYEDEKCCIEYFRSDIDKDKDTLTLQSEEAWQYEWIDPRELDKYEFPLNMKQNIQKMLFPNREIVQKLGKAFKSGKITKEKFLQALDMLSKSFSHKYISKKPDGKGGWEYKYEDKKEKTKLKKVLKSVESEIVKLKYEHGYCFDKDGNEIFNHTSHQERSIDLSAFESKLKNNIFTHNHPGNNEPSIYDIDICLFSQMKEMRSVSLDSQYGKGTYVMKNDLTEPFQMKDHVEELNKSYEDWYDNKQHTHKNGWIDVFKLSSFFEGIKNSVHFSFEKDNGEIIQL